MMVRIPLSVMTQVEAHRRLGRTDRQVEKIVGLAHGTLSRPFIVDDSQERHAAEIRQQRIEWSERDRRFWQAVYGPRRKTPQGWRPQHDCLTDRPNAGTHHRPTRKAS